MIDDMLLNIINKTKLLWTNIFFGSFELVFFLNDEILSISFLGLVYDILHLCKIFRLELLYDTFKGDIEIFLPCVSK